MAASHDEEVEVKTESTENLFDRNSTIVKQLDSAELLCQLKTEIKMEKNFNSPHSESYSCLAQTTLKSPIKEYHLGLFSNKVTKCKDPNTFSLSGNVQSSEDNCWVKEDSTELEMGVHQAELNTNHSTDEEGDEELWYTGATQTETNAKTDDYLLHTTSSPNSAYSIQNSDLQTDTVRKSLVKTGKKQKTDKIKNCTLCGKNFTRPDHLKIHMRIHTGEKPYKCTECGKCFVRCGELSTHMRFHRGEKPYSCSKCSKSFTSSTHLKEHEWTHTGIKPYACSQCEKSYAHAGDLVKHRRIHTGERPYPCMECGVSFRRMGTLKKHQKRHSRPQSFSCVHCKKVFAFEGHLQAHVKSYCKKLKSIH